MKPAWSLKRSAINGAVIGALYVVGSAIMEGGAMDAARMVGIALGGGAGGAALFALAASIRNGMVGAK